MTMTMTFTFADSYICISRSRCEICRANATWRKGFNAPDVCPNGVTQEMLDKYAKTHPEQWRNTGTVSNCCGRADQA